jgi:hypothetical protein
MRAGAESLRCCDAAGAALGNLVLQRQRALEKHAGRHAAALIEAAVFSMISPI